MKLDTLYMIVHVKRQGIVYAAPALTAHEAWANVIKPGIMGTLNTKAGLIRAGWRAKRVDISLAEKKA